MNQAIEKVDKKPISVLQFIHEKQAEFVSVMPSHLSPDRMMRIALSAIKTTPKLAACTIQSVGVSLMACSALGLEPNTPLGHAYMIPFNQKYKDGNQWKSELRCQLIIGYKGYIELFYRSGVVQSAQAFPVFEGDKFSYSLGLKPDLIHVPTDNPERWNSGKLTHTYFVLRMKDLDVPLFNVLDRGTINAHRERSKSKDDGPWKTDYIKMAMKTAVRDIVPYVPFSVERPAAAASFEHAIMSGNSRSAVLSLGPQAIESTGLLLEGIPEDVEPSDDPEEKPTLDSVSASLKTNSTPKDEATETLRKDAIAAAHELWGDKAMLTLSHTLKSQYNGASIQTCGADVLDPLLRGLSSEIDKRNSREPGQEG